MVSYFSIFVVGFESLIAYKLNVYCDLRRQCASAAVTALRTLPVANSMLLSLLLLSATGAAGAALEMYRSSYHAWKT